MECSFVFLFELTHFPGKFPRISAGASLLSCSLSWRSVLKLQSVGTSLMMNFDRIFPSDGPFLSRMFAWRNAALVNRTLRIDSNTLVPFLEIVAEFGGSVSCDTQLNCRALFHTSICTFVITLLQLFVWLFLNLPVRELALCQHSQGRFGARTFHIRLNFSDWFLPLACLFLDSLLPRIFDFLWLRGWYGFRSQICTIVTLTPEATLVSLRTLAFFSPPVTGTLCLFEHHLILCDS